MTAFALDIQQISCISTRPESLRVATMHEQLPLLRALREVVRDRWSTLDDVQREALRELVGRAEALPRPNLREIVATIFKVSVGLMFDYSENHRTLFQYAAEFARLIETIRAQSREDDVRQADVTVPAAPTTFNEMLAASYARDHASQLARVAIRPRSPEALDLYFESTDDEESGEISPVLQRYRERTAFQLQSV